MSETDSTSNEGLARLRTLAGVADQLWAYRQSLDAATDKQLEDEFVTYVGDRWAGKPVAQADRESLKRALNADYMAAVNQMLLGPLTEVTLPVRKLGVPQERMKVDLSAFLDSGK
ncbi:hypothetical protein [Aureliella helgolandensis]|uniref:Uncharacterized protein n=1 Tax=Aureliella helgolandensis TaxID=2527968 RepID=A0A518G878_9BACT|nr:hypothetical protein [Aureliella helgolandensis]QDV24783.1 hypothetical protein Q31a_31050 [Aureliella helgolandensis]